MRALAGLPRPTLSEMMACDNATSSDAWGASAWLLDGGERLHLQHGPIDLIVSVDAPPAVRAASFERALAHFHTVLPTLVDELPQLRKQLEPLSTARLRGSVARRMSTAVSALAPAGLTPMAAVAGAVADHILDVIGMPSGARRVMVNNGGDIAFNLNADESCVFGVCPSPQSGEYPHRVRIRATDGVRGVATSGWQGRSFSLGIADAVTVLAESAARADAAATAIANAVDLPDNVNVLRAPARSLDPDTDLGEQCVTVDVAALTSREKRQALSAGSRYAQTLVDQGLVEAVFLTVQGETRSVSRTPQLRISDAFSADVPPVRQSARSQNHDAMLELAS